jgi:hypothetical protein
VLQPPPVESEAARQYSESTGIPVVSVPDTQSTQTAEGAMMEAGMTGAPSGKVPLIPLLLLGGVLAFSYFRMQKKPGG